MWIGDTARSTDSDRSSGCAALVGARIDRRRRGIDVGDDPERRCADTVVRACCGNVGGRIAQAEKAADAGPRRFGHHLAGAVGRRSGTPSPGRTRSARGPGARLRARRPSRQVRSSSREIIARIVLAVSGRVPSSHGSASIDDAAPGHVHGEIELARLWFGQFESEHPLDRIVRAASGGCVGCGRCRDRCDRRRGCRACLRP